MNTTTRNFKVGAAVAMATLLAIGAAAAAPAHAAGYYGPRNTVRFERLPPVKQTCGAVYAPSLAGPRPGRFEKVKDLGKCPVKEVVRWVGPRATIPVYSE